MITGIVIVQNGGYIQNGGALANNRSHFQMEEEEREIHVFLAAASSLRPTLLNIRPFLHDLWA